MTDHKEPVPCGGCGCKDPAQRCVGCRHPFFEIAASSAPKASAVPEGENKYPFPPSQAFKYACEMVAKQATTIIKKEPAAAAPQAEAQIKTDGCAGFQGLPIASCGPCTGNGCDAASDTPERVQPSINTNEFCALLMAVCKAEALFAATAGTANQYGPFEEACEARQAIIVHIDAKLTQAREKVRQVIKISNQTARTISSERDEWKAKAIAAEEKLASIRAALDKE